MYCRKGRKGKEVVIFGAGNIGKETCFDGIQKSYFAIKGLCDSLAEYVVPVVSSVCDVI